MFWDSPFNIQLNVSGAVDRCVLVDLIESDDPGMGAGRDEEITTRARNGPGHWKRVIGWNRDVGWNLERHGIAGRNLNIVWNTPFIIDGIICVCRQLCIM